MQSIDMLITYSHGGLTVSCAQRSISLMHPLLVLWLVLALRIYIFIFLVFYIYKNMSQTWIFSVIEL